MPANTTDRYGLAVTMLPVLLGLLCDPAQAEPLSYFRRQGGLAQGTGELPADLGSGARLRWKTPLPPGNSSPCVHGQRIFLTSYDQQADAGQQLATVALDRDSGRILWKRSAPTRTLEAFHPVGSPASSTPACDGQRVYSFFGSFGLLCYDLEGTLLWQHALGPFQDEFGASSSPVLVDNLVILNEDHDVDSFLIAIDQRSGKTVWKTPRDEFTRSYSTPVIWEDPADGSKQIIVAGALQVAGYDARSGRKLWWLNGISRIVDSTPSLAGGHLILATWTPGGDPGERISMEAFDEALANLDKNQDGKIEKSELPPGSPVEPRFFRIDLNQDQKLDRSEWDKHASVFKEAQNVAISLRPGGRGPLQADQVQWVFRRGLPTVPSSVVYEDVLYMVKDGGIITSLDARNGELLKQGRAEGRGNYYASLLAGDGKVYLASERGILTILAAGRSWEVLAKHDFEERIMATPAAADGQLIVRTDQALYCFEKQ